jgi:hypothetical protein
VDSAVNNFVQIHFRPLFLCAALTSRIYKNGAQTSACGAAFSGYEWSIPMFRAKIPHFTSKIVEHSRHLPSNMDTGTHRQNMAMVVRWKIYGR